MLRSGMQYVQDAMGSNLGYMQGLIKQKDSSCRFCNVDRLYIDE